MYDYLILLIINIIYVCFSYSTINDNINIHSNINYKKVSNYIEEKTNTNRNKIRKLQSNDDGSSNQNSYSDGRSSDVSYSKLVRYENSSSSVSPSTNGATSSGSNSEASTSAGAGLAGASKSTSRAYEVIKKIEDDSDSIVKFVGLAIICEILLIIGYKRKEKDEI